MERWGVDDGEDESDMGGGSDGEEEGRGELRERGGRARRRIELSSFDSGYELHGLDDEVQQFHLEMEDGAGEDGGGRGAGGAAVAVVEDIAAASRCRRLRKKLQHICRLEKREGLGSLVDAVGVASPIGACGLVGRRRIA